jgi:hypothetical protein
MPVTDHFSKTINANANSLGAKIPEMVATPDDSSNVNRRAAESAEHAFPEMDKESGMDVLNPILAKHDALWGLGCTKETVCTSPSAGIDELPEIGLESQQMFVCADCGWQGSEPVEVCPQCGSPNIETSEDVSPQAGDVQQFPKGKLCTEVIPIMEIYLPRDCRDPNLSPVVTHRFRKSKEKAAELYPDAGALPIDQERNLSQFYIEALRSLVMSSTESGEMVTFTEHWANWDELTKEVKEAIEQEWGSQPSTVPGYEGLSRLQAAQQYGIYFIWAGGKIVAKGENPWDGKKCFTFFPWEKDPASPYNMGLGSRLVPLQKRLNRTDSLMELSEMTNSVGKWLVPNTQQTVFKPTGSPHDMHYYDPLGEGKLKPEFVLPAPYGPAIVAKRAQIIQDFKELGYTEGVATGDTPEGVKSFRGIAYLGAKAEESIQTQRFLWEQGHRIRKELLLVMTRKVWDEPRKAKVAGFNNRFGMQELSGADLQGDYGIDVLKDSSKPKTRQEKLEALQLAATGGMINPQDAPVREYTMNSLGLNEVNASDHYDYVKADRDLEKLKQGMQPFETPFAKWDIPLKIIADYTKTEEFEELDPAIQQGILLYAQYLSDKLTMINQTTGAMPPNPMQMAGQLGAALGGKSPLNGVPGVTEKPGAAEGAAKNQGDSFAKSLSA